MGSDELPAFPAHVAVGFGVEAEPGKTRPIDMLDNDEAVLTAAHPQASP
jgi:hypothetical protein